MIFQKLPRVAGELFSTRNFPSQFNNKQIHGIDSYSILREVLNVQSKKKEKRNPKDICMHIIFKLSYYFWTHKPGIFLSQDLYLCNVRNTHYNNVNNFYKMFECVYCSYHIKPVSNVYVKVKIL